MMDHNHELGRQQMKFDVLLAEHGPARKLYHKVARLPFLIPFPHKSRLQNSRFRTFSEGAKRRKRDPRVGSARASHARRRVRRENDCRLFIQRIRSKRESFNVTEVTEIA